MYSPGYKGENLMKVSVIISVYNGEKYLSRAIRSAIHQSLDKGQYEILVINDGSTDHTAKVMDSFGDWIRTIHREENKGLAYSCNEGIKSALGEYVIRLDADDYINRDLLLVTSLILDQNKDTGFVWTDHQVVGEKGDIKQVVQLNTLNPAQMLAAGIMFRKSVIEDVGLYDESMSGVEGEDLLMRILSHPNKYGGFHLPLNFHRYFRHEDNMTNNKDVMKERLKKLSSKIGSEKNGV
jgi:glycosyltransferase involved in cell wall biosynthesis